MKRLVVGAVSTAIGATASYASDASQQLAQMEPNWLNLAIKWMTLAAGATTVAAGLVKIYLDLRKDRREERKAEHDISS